MNCTLCNGETARRTEEYLCQSKALGDVPLPLIEVDTCLRCGSKMLSAEAATQVAGYLKTLETNAIRSLPADDLISAGQAAGLLGVSKQAFSKNPKIKKGFVYFIPVGTKKVYFRSSVELFRKKGDGRFQINRWTSSVPDDRISCHPAGDDLWRQINGQAARSDCSLFTWSTSSQEK